MLPPAPLPVPAKPRRALVALLPLLAVACARVQAAPEEPPAAPAAAATALDAEAATSSRACAACHPAIYAEHMANTHGLAFVDEEARLATRDFKRENCVRCHTPRPIAETGLGMVPIERRHDLEEGNTCMSCHARTGYDYGHFRGGAECRVAFEENVGTVESCATCHRIAGTPEQWEHAMKGKRAGSQCVDCHMPLVERPVAVGMAPRPVRAHVFPASRSESQLRRAYRYRARIEGNEVVVTITNAGAGHNFPTGSIQRALESDVTIRDAQGNEVASSRAVLKVPYLSATGLALPRSAQIPSAQSREHRVPIPTASGTVECRLFFKRYYPIEDGHPTLSRRLECQSIPFSGISPSTHVALVPLGAPPGLPEVSPAEAARPDGLAKYAQLPPGTPSVAIPEGDAPEDIERLVAILEFPVPGARVIARRRLAELGTKAVPALVEALGHWSDETRDQSMELLLEIGDPATAPLVKALADDRLYVRYHARMVLARMHPGGDVRAEVRETLVRDLARPHPLDRRSAADALGGLGDPAAAPALRPLLEDPDRDVVASAAQALGRLDDRASVPAMEAALRRATFVESRRDLAAALATLGSAAGVPALLEGLDYPDDLIRKSIFDAFFEVTGLHESYDPDAPRLTRLEALARLQSAWAREGASCLRRPPTVDPEADERAWRMVEA
ncbi:MAG TPA: HEAT repeat domain-containing protein, partial [Planctomycetota bacterium]|nr:HEAT repeat domain-containing protein [Planctomycetota bacterium]